MGIPMSLPAPCKPRILIVDDDPAFLEFMALALEGENYRVQTVLHGAAALDAVQQTRPQLILLDVRMPVMDGWEFLRAYYRQPAPHVPVIALSATIGLEEQALEAGAVAFFPKPFDLNTLLIEITRVLSAAGQPDQKFPAQPDCA